MEGLAYIYMALAYEEAQTNNASQAESKKLILEQQKYVTYDLELSSEDVNKNYNNFCTAKF